MIVDHNSGKSLKHDIVFWDETLRDGEQAPGVSFTVDQKIQLATLLDKLGIDIIDIGFPPVSDDEQQAIKEISRLDLNAKLGVTVRANKSDIDLAMNCNMDTVFLFSPTSKLHIVHKFGLDYEQLQSKIFGSVEYAIKKGMDVFFISEDTSRSDLNFIVPLFNWLYELGVKTIMITDTIGIMRPGKMKELVSQIINGCHTGMQFGVHCHNDFGLATANTLAAIEAGVTHPTTTVNGIGERSGNASFEEVVCSLEFIYKYKTNLALKKLKPLSDKVSLFSGMPIPPNKAIVGFNAFRHESGIHIKALLKELKTYEPFSCEIVGQTQDFILGKHSNDSLIEHMLNQHGIQCCEETMAYFTKLIQKRLMSAKEKKQQFYQILQEYYNNCLGISTKNISSEILKFSDKAKDRSHTELIVTE